MCKCKKSVFGSVKEVYHFFALYQTEFVLLLQVEVLKSVHLYHTSDLL